MELRNISTKDLMDELLTREEVRDMNVNPEESYRIIASGIGRKHERFIKCNGRVKVIEIKV